MSQARQASPSVTSPIFWHFTKKLLPWLVAIAAYIVVATLIVRWDMARTGEAGGDPGADAYGIYTQLFFEPTQALPRAPVARLLFWVTPLFGVALIVRGLVRVGGSLFDVDERQKLWVKIMSDQMKEHVVLCGLGHVGIRVAESLVQLGVPVVAIEKVSSESFAADVEKLGVPVLYGDARRDAILLEAGIRRARAVVCATDDDLTNLEVAIDSRRENPTIRVIMRVFDQRVAGKIGDALDLDQTFSSAALAGPLVALQAIEKGVIAVYRVGDGTTRVDMEVKAPRTFWEKQVEVCEDLVDGRIVAVQRDGKTLPRPRHDTVIREGDVLSIDIPADNVARLRS